MRGGAETIEAEAPAVASLAQGPVADEAGTHQRCRLGIRIALRYGQAIACIGHDVVGIAACALVTCELGLIAEILPARPALLASAACIAEPGHTDAITGGEIAHT